MKGKDQNEIISTLSTMIDLEFQAKQAKKIDDIRFLIVNKSYDLVKYDSLFLLEKKQIKFVLTAASNISVIKAASPLQQWLISLVNDIAEKDNTGEIISLTANKTDQLWKKFAPKYLQLVPLKIELNTFAYLAFFRNTQWTEAELFILGRLSSSYGYYLNSHVKKNKINLIDISRKRKYKIIISIAIFIFFLIPIKLTVIAPAEIIPLDPSYISSPITGTIKDVYVEPNQKVFAGDKILSFEDSDLRANYLIAQKSVQVAKTNLLKASQAAFNSIKEKGDIGLFKAELDKAEAELEYSAKKLSYIDYNIKSNGTILYQDKNALIGRAVSLGEKLMILANDNEVQIRIDIAAQDMIDLPLGSTAVLFLTNSPLKSIKTKINYIAYRASINEDNILSFRIRSTIDEKLDTIPRIGSKGTTRIKGSQTIMFYFLFRKPIIWLRQTIGI